MTTTARNFAAELAAAREAEDWTAHARIWEERRAASVASDEAALAYDTDEAREEIRRVIRRQRDQLSALAHMLEGIDHEAARDVETARSALFAAWSKVRKPSPEY